jgi:hypothetical protein
MNCCDDYGICTRAQGCPAGSFKPVLPAEGREFFTPADAQQRARQLGEPLYRVSMLRITASDGMRWYRGMVGQLVPYCGWEVGQGFVSREPGGFLNFVEFEHATRADVAVTAKELGLWPAKHAQESGRGAPFDPACINSKAQAKRAPTKRGTATSTATSNQASARASAPVGQSRAGSLAEALTNVLVGFVVSVLITAVLLPAMGHAVTLTENILMTTVFTVASIARSYLLRRAFNKGAAA